MTMSNLFIICALLAAGFGVASAVFGGSVSESVRVQFYDSLQLHLPLVDVTGQQAMAIQSGAEFFASSENPNGHISDKAHIPSGSLICFVFTIKLTQTHKPAQGHGRHFDVFLFIGDKLKYCNAVATWGFSDPTADELATLPNEAEREILAKLGVQYFLERNGEHMVDVPDRIKSLRADHRVTKIGEKEDPTGNNGAHNLYLQVFVTGYAK